MGILNDQFAQYSETFLGNSKAANDIPLREILKVKKLNYSVKSIKEIDRYLQCLFEKRQPEKATAEYQNLVTWCGAYIGEVIRRNAATEYNWIDYEDYMENKDPNLRDTIPYMLTTHALLYSKALDFMTMPLNKVVRFLTEGKTHSVYLYASGDLIKKRIVQ